MLRHGRREAVRLIETDADARAPILRRYLAVAPGARAHIPVDRRATPAEFERIAVDVPPDRFDSRNGTSAMTVLTEIGPVQIEVPRDPDASFEPVIVRKRQRRLDGIDEIVLSLTPAVSPPGRTPRTSTRSMAPRSARTPSAGSPTRSSRRWRSGRTGRPTWSTRCCSSTPIHVKVRDGQVTNWPFYVVIGVTVDGHRDILGMAGDGGEGAKC